MTNYPVAGETPALVAISGACRPSGDDGAAYPSGSGSCLQLLLDDQLTECFEYPQAAQKGIRWDLRRASTTSESPLPISMP